MDTPLTPNSDKVTAATQGREPRSCAEAAGSALPETCVDFHGRPLRRVDRKRLLKTGEYVANMHGQFLWELMGFSHEGVRIGDGIHGTLSDYTWERFYLHFYEHAPVKKADEQNGADQPRPANGETK